MMFKAAQGPVGRRLSAERLQQAADANIIHENQFLVRYLRAHDAATKEAASIAYAVQVM
jgi:hypothetical protein